MIPLNDPDIRRRTRPYLVYLLILANVVVAVFQMFTLTVVEEAAFVFRYGAIPWELTGQGVLGSISLAPGVTVDTSTPLPIWTSMFTSMFLHGGLLHLGGNMLFLWVFGDNIEDRFGHLKFIAFYLLAGVAAVWAQVYINPDSQVPMIGASGAIAGVLGAYIVMFPHSRVHTLIIFVFIMHMRLPAIILLGAWAVLQALNGIGSLGITSAGSGVAYFAHLGGFAAGLLAGVLYRLFRGSSGPPRRPSQYWRGRPVD